MLIQRRIVMDICSLTRRKDKVNLISAYEEAKNAILEVEDQEGVKTSYFSEETQMRKEIEKDYQEMIKIKDKENEVLKLQLKALKSLEEQFKNVNKQLIDMQKIANDKDTKIKNLEVKIKKAEASAAA